MPLYRLQDFVTKKPNQIRKICITKKPRLTGKRE